MKTLTITEEDIKLGEVGSGRCCPIARCMKREGFPDVYVTETAIYPDCKTLVPMNDCVEVALPHEAQEFVENFDNEQPVVPLAFEVEL